MATTEIYTILVLAAILVIIAVRLFTRLRKNASGARYSLRSILLLPILYSAITFFLMIGMPVSEDAILVISLIIGIAIGLLLGRRSEIFEKDGKMMYRRSAVIMAIWLVGFIARVGLEFVSGSFDFGPGMTPLSPSGAFIFGADVLLAFSAGLLLGEAIMLYRSHSMRYRKD